MKGEQAKICSPFIAHYQKPLSHLEQQMRVASTTHIAAGHDGAPVYA